MPLLMLIVCLTSACFSLAGEAKTLQLIVNIPLTTPKNEAPYLTGKIPGYCEWQPNCLRLKKLGNQNFGVTLQLPAKTTEFPFKITRGSWNKQAATSMGRMLPDRKISLKSEETKIVLNIANWTDRQAFQKVGRFQYHRKFYSPELQNHRDITVWLPPGYQHSSKRYPVLYMHDGQNIFDPQSNMFGNEWGVDETATRMIINRDVVPFIIIGIPSSQNRNGEYTYRRDGKDYAHFLINTLKPFIDRTYRTKSEAQNNFLMGSSMGALISLTIAWNHGDVFLKAAALSLPVFAHDYELYRFMEENPIPSPGIQLYFDHGQQGQDANYKEPAEQFVRDLKTQYQFSQSSFEYLVFPFADHTEIDWARRLETPLRFLLPKPAH